MKTPNHTLEEGEAIAESELERAFEVWWPRLETVIKTLPSEPQPAPRRTLDDMVSGWSEGGQRATR